MFFKNDSEYRCSFRTKKEVHDLKPGDCVEVMEMDLLGEPNSVLVRITENEYNEWKKSGNVVEDIVVDENVDQTDVDDKKEDNGDDKKQDKKQEPDDKKEAKSWEEKSFEQQLEDLKAQWEEAKRPNKKAQIAKQIKDLQEKIKNQA